MLPRLATILTSTVIALAGCEPVPLATGADQTSQASAPLKTMTLNGKGGMSSVGAPDGCEKIAMSTLRSGRSKNVRTGCSVRSGDATIVVGLNEITVPFQDAFDVSGGRGGDFQAVAARFPRETLSEFVVKSEKSAMSALEPGWRYAKKRSRLLPGDGGVEGAAACVEFSFDATSTSGPRRKSRFSGLRCARFGPGANTIQELMLEVMLFSPADQRPPESYGHIASIAKQSLRYR